jgi:hypothetical protein
MELLCWVVGLGWALAGGGLSGARPRHPCGQRRERLLLHPVRRPLIVVLPAAMLLARDYGLKLTWHETLGRTETVM